MSIDSIPLFLVFIVLSFDIALWIIAYKLVYIAFLMQNNTKKINEIGNQK